MPQTKSWLMSLAELDSERIGFAKCYFGKGGHIFRRPHGAGYWLYGVDYHHDRGWLAFEFDDDTFDAEEEYDHAPAIQAWEKGESLPHNYFALTADVVDKVFKNGLKKWGEDWIDEIDLPSTDAALQWTLLGEQRYG